MSISNLQIYNALNAYAKQMRFSIFVQKQKPGNITTAMDTENASENPGSHPFDTGEEEKRP